MGSWTRTKEYSPMIRNYRGLKIWESLLCRGRDDWMCNHSFIWLGGHIDDTLPCAGHYTRVAGTKAWSLPSGMRRRVGWGQKQTEDDSSSEWVTWQRSAQGVPQPRVTRRLRGAPRKGDMSESWKRKEISPMDEWREWELNRISPENRIKHAKARPKGFQEPTSEWASLERKWRGGGDEWLGSSCKGLQVRGQSKETLERYKEAHAHTKWGDIHWPLVETAWGGTTCPLFDLLKR